MSRVYLYNADTAGYAIDAPDGTGYHWDALTAATPIFKNVSAACASRTDPSTVYAVENGSNRFGVSHDGGASWTVKLISNLTPAPTFPTINAMVSVAPGQIHLYQNWTSGSLVGKHGVWRSIDNGDSWTLIRSGKVPMAPQTDPFGGYLSAGTTKIWYALCGQDTVTRTSPMRSISSSGPRDPHAAPLGIHDGVYVYPSEVHVHLFDVHGSVGNIYIGWVKEGNCAIVAMPGGGFYFPCVQPQPGDTIYDIEAIPWMWRTDALGADGFYIGHPMSGESGPGELVIGMAYGAGPGGFSYTYEWTEIAPIVTTHTLIEVHRCNLDGSSDQMMGTIAYDVPSGQLAPTSVTVRAINDNFCFVVSPSGHAVHKVTDTGITRVTPTGLDRPWDVGIFDNNRMICVGSNTSSGNNVLTFRSTQAGVSWQAGPFIPANQGFVARNLTRNQVIDVYRTVPPDPANPPMEAVMYGYADAGTKQYLHRTTDFGANWAPFRNEAELTAGGGWADLGIGGIIAAPAAIGGPQVMILG